ncbi:hypothetical protein IIY24_00165 [Candidatus Saccharibacteria bacterium]|nr:hypothetical protein [Candidatus Saccharibacteria bacterium]
MSRLDNWFICTDSHFVCAGHRDDNNKFWIPLEIKDAFPRRSGEEAKPTKEELMYWWNDEFYDASPLEQNSFFCGKVYNDPRPEYFDGGFVDGTSTVLEFKRNQYTGYHIQTRNTKYELGYMNSNYRDLLGYIAEGVISMEAVEETFGLFRRMNDPRLPRYVLQMLLGEQTFDEGRVRSYFANRRLLKF